MSAEMSIWVSSVLRTIVRFGWEFLAGDELTRHDDCVLLDGVDESKIK